MPFSGSAGSKTFSRTTSVYTGTTAWQQTDAASRGIRSDDHDNHDQDIATAVNTSLQKNGDNSLTANIPAAGFGFTGLGVLSSVAEISVASASTTNILASAAVFVLITGTVTITSLGTGTNTFKIVRFNGILTLTHNGTSLILPGAANIQTAANDMMGVVSDGSSNARVIWYQKASGTSVAAANSGFTGQLFGCTISNNSGGTTAIAVAAGTARDSTDVDNLVVPSAITAKTLGTAWAVGSSAGLLDTGAVANTTYHIYLIKRLDTGVVDVIASTSASAPTLPTNYTLYRRIGSILRESGAVVLFSQNGDEFLRNTPVQDIAVNTTGTSAVLRTLSVPTGIKVNALLAGNIANINNDSTSIYLLMTSPDAADTAASTTAYTATALAAAGSAGSTWSAAIRTSTSAQVRSRMSASNANYGFNINTFGWTDTRGRLA